MSLRVVERVLDLGSHSPIHVKEEGAEEYLFVLSVNVKTHNDSPPIVSVIWMQPDFDKGF